MKFINIMRFGDAVLRDIHRNAEWTKITDKDIIELGVFLKTKTAKDMEDYNILERIHLIASLFVFHKNETEEPPVKKMGSKSQG